MWGWVLLGFLLPWSGFSQNSYSLALAENQAFPVKITDTVDYSLGFLLVNNHPTLPFTGPVDVMMSVNDDEPSLLTSFNISSPLMPGDTVKAPAFSHHFNEARFTGGGGLTYDIIVWPMSVGSGQSDSLYQAVSYLHTQQNARHIQVTSPAGGFPGEIIDGTPYDLHLTVINHDSVYALYQPVAFAIDGAGISSYELMDFTKLKAPVQPGDSVSFLVPAHTFDVTTGGGGLTYDIIVWPMSVGTPKRDSMLRTVRIYDAAAIEVFSTPSAPLDDPLDGNATYQTDFTFRNQGNHATSQPIDLVIQVDEDEPIVHSTYGIGVEAGDTVVVSVSDFEILSHLPSGLAEGTYDLRMFAQEQGTSNWLGQLLLTLVVEAPTPETELVLNQENGSVLISWERPYDVGQSIYDIQAEPTDRDDPFRPVSSVPAIPSPEAPIRYQTRDVTPQSGLNTYRLIERNPRNNVRKVLARNSVDVHSTGLSGQVLCGIGGRDLRIFHLNLTEGSDVRIVWYDLTGRVIGEKSAYLPAGTENWPVVIPRSSSGVVYWVLTAGAQSWSGQTMRR